MKRIQLLAPSSRPREKILKSGAEILTTEELLAVILITGVKNNPVSKLSGKIAKLLQKSPGLNKESLLSLKIGPSKTAQILAVLELSKRLTLDPVISITSANQIYAQSQDIISSEKESLGCFYLNARGDLIKKEILAVGALNKVNLLPAEIFSVIKEQPVAGIILVHNHPSGILDPSDEDVLFTKRIKAAGEILGVKLLDHLIISKKGWKRIKL